MEEIDKYGESLAYSDIRAAHDDMKRRAAIKATNYSDKAIQQAMDALIAEKLTAYYHAEIDGEPKELQPMRIFKIKDYL